MVEKRQLNHPHRSSQSSQWLNFLIPPTQQFDRSFGAIFLMLSEDLIAQNARDIAELTKAIETLRLTADKAIECIPKFEERHEKLEQALLDSKTREESSLLEIRAIAREIERSNARVEQITVAHTEASQRVAKSGVLEMLRYGEAVAGKLFWAVVCVTIINLLPTAVNAMWDTIPARQRAGLSENVFRAGSYVGLVAIAAFLLKGKISASVTRADELSVEADRSDQPNQKS